MDIGRQPPAHRDFRTRIVVLHNLWGFPSSEILVWYSHGRYLGAGGQYCIGECTSQRQRVDLGLPATR